MATPRFPVAAEQTPGPRIFFEFLDESEFISICPNREKERLEDEQRAKAKAKEFEFLSGNSTNTLPADELFCQGRLLPSLICRHSETKLNRIALKPKGRAGDGKTIGKEESNRAGWFIDDDPSPRPPKCTVLWKELLRLKKQRGSSPDLSTSSSFRSAGDERKEGTRTGGIVRIRPVINVPICSQAKNPMIAMRKGRLQR